MLRAASGFVAHKTCTASPPWPLCLQMSRTRRLSETRDGEMPTGQGDGMHPRAGMEALCIALTLIWARYIRRPALDPAVVRVALFYAGAPSCVAVLGCAIGVR